MNDNSWDYCEANCGPVSLMMSGASCLQESLFITCTSPGKFCIQRVVSNGARKQGVVLRTILRYSAIVGKHYCGGPLAAAVTSVEMLAAAST
jgi:hypothetical protein